MLFTIKTFQRSNLTFRMLSEPTSAISSQGVSEVAAPLLGGCALVLVQGAWLRPSGDASSSPSAWDAAPGWPPALPLPPISSPRAVLGGGAFLSPGPHTPGDSSPSRPLPQLSRLRESSPGAHPEPLPHPGTKAAVLLVPLSIPLLLGTWLSLQPPHEVWGPHGHPPSSCGLTALVLRVQRGLGE